MGVFDKFERKVEGAINGIFSRAFKADVQPVEIASAIRRAMDDRASVVNKGRTVVPNIFTIELAFSDYDRITQDERSIIEVLMASAAEHAEQQRFVPGGPFHISFKANENLETGVFNVRSSMAKNVPSSSSRPENQEWSSQQYGNQISDDAYASGLPGHVLPPEYTNQQSTRPPSGHPADPAYAQGGYAAPAPEVPHMPQQYRPSVAAAPADGVTGLASHASSAAVGGMAAAAGARAMSPEGYGYSPDQYHQAGYQAAGQPSYVDPYTPEAPADPYSAQPSADPYAAYASPQPAYSDPYAAEQYPAADPYGSADQYAPAAEQRAPSPHVAPGFGASADPSTRPWLTIDGETYPLLGAITIIGRDAAADITLADAGISRQHCEIRVTHDGPHFVITVRDLGSTNGTFVNGDPIDVARVSTGDRVTVGRTSMVIQQNGR